MPVIVFSKRTGKYLKRHSGSFNKLISRINWKDEVKERIHEELGQRPNWIREGLNGSSNNEEWYKWGLKARQIKEDYAFDAAPEDARVYATHSSATTSVGVWNRGKDFKNRVFILPDHLELHEIKEAFICVMRPDGSSNCDEDDKG